MSDLAELARRTYDRLSPASKAKLREAYVRAQQHLEAPIARPVVDRLLGRPVDLADVAATVLDHIFDGGDGG